MDNMVSIRYQTDDGVQTNEVEQDEWRDEEHYVVIEREGEDIQKIPREKLLEIEKEEEESSSSRVIVHDDW